MGELVDVPGPHGPRREDAITFSWVREMKPIVVALVIGTATVVGSWYKVQALDADQTTRADTMKMDLEAQKKRIDALEADRAETKAQLQRIDERTKLLLCKLFPNDCRP